MPVQKVSLKTAIATSILALESCAEKEIGENRWELIRCKEKLKEFKDQVAKVEGDVRIIRLGKSRKS